MFIGWHLCTFKRGEINWPDAWPSAVSRWVLTPGFDGNLMLWPAAAWERWAVGLAALNLASPESRQVRRLLMGHAVTVQLRDERLMLPAFWQEIWPSPPIMEQVVLAGQGHFIEIWSPQAWKAQQTTLWQTDWTQTQLVLPALQGGEANS